MIPPLRAMLLLCAMLAPAAARAEDVTNAQKRAAAEYLAAVASGSAQAVALAIHPNEMDRLRLRLLTALREENKVGSSMLRSRLFGAAVSLADVERMTSTTLFAALSRRLVLVGREFQDLKGVTAVREGKETVHVVVKLVPPKDRGTIETLQVVTLVPYGKDWKAAVPAEVEAQIQDLVAGRELPGAGRLVAAEGDAAAGRATAGPRASNSPEILAMLRAAESALAENRCADYYRRHLSPSLRRSMSARTLDTLIASCTNNLGTRELLIAAVRTVAKLPPKYEFDGARATYDVSGQGLPYDRFVLERVENVWYIAE